MKVELSFEKWEYNSKREKDQEIIRCAGKALDSKS